MAGFEFFPKLMYKKNQYLGPFVLPESCFLSCVCCHSTHMDSDEPTPDVSGEIQGGRTRVKLRMPAL